MCLCIFKLGYVLSCPLEVEQCEDWVQSCLSAVEYPLLKRAFLSTKGRGREGEGKVDTEVQIIELQSSNLPESKAAWSHSDSLGTSAEQGKDVPLSIGFSLPHCFRLESCGNISVTHLMSVFCFYWRWVSCDVNFDHNIQDSKYRKIPPPHIT